MKDLHIVIAKAGAAYLHCSFCLRWLWMNIKVEGRGQVNDPTSNGAEIW